jgi:glycosyltransferase involved in cell wall biosynthesis
MINLHVMHSWGGGLERWVQDYCRADQRDTNFVLKSIGASGVPARKICLYQHIDDTVPIRVWPLDKPILATAVNHLEYRYILQEIIDVFHINNLLISSFIGHALELLQIDIRTMIICHDFYPFCPVIVAYFKENCQECNFSHLKKCFADNTTQFFPFTSAIEWMEIRNVFIETLQRQQIQLIVPSPFMKSRLISLEPKLAEVPILVISHGVSPLTASKLPTLDQGTSFNRKPRILILGDLSDHKGFDLFSQICDQLDKTVDFYLLGCGDNGKLFEHKSHVKIIPRYQRSELAKMVNELDIDLGLLLSICTETFSYTLSELMLMGIPALATNIGSFTDRIEDGTTGFLVNPVSADIISKINFLVKNDHVLETVRNNLLNFKYKSTKLMVLEYQEQLDISSPKIKQIDIPSLDQTILNSLNYDELIQMLQLWQQELVDIKYSQAKISNRLEQQEFYPNWEISKKIRTSTSQRFKTLKYIKYLFPSQWNYLRIFALRIKSLR